MTNGSDDWKVSFSHISWFEKFLLNHKNVVDVDRVQDILFEINGKAQKDHLRILCCNEYTMGLALVQRGINEFGVLGGYTRQAKEYCISQQTGLFVTDEMSGAIWRDEY